MLTNFLGISLLLFTWTAMATGPCSDIFKHSEVKGSRGVASTEGESFRALKVKLEKESDPQVIKNGIANLWQALVAKQNRDLAYKTALDSKGSLVPAFIFKVKDPVDLRETAIYLMHAVWKGTDSKAVDSFLTEQKEFKRLNTDCLRGDPNSSDVFKKKS